MKDTLYVETAIVHQKSFLNKKKQQRSLVFSGENVKEMESDPRKNVAYCL